MAETDCNLMSKEPISVALLGLVLSYWRVVWLVAYRQLHTAVGCVLPAISTEHYHCS